MKKRVCKENQSLKRGFTLLELLLMVTIVGVLFTVIVPKLIHFRIDAQHEIVRQSCRELTASVQGWLHRMLTAQNDHSSTATMADYVATLAHRLPPDDPFSSPQESSGQWLGTIQRPNNWNVNNLQRYQGTQRVAIYGRTIGGKRNTPPESVVENDIPKDRGIVNPFNQENIFRSANDPLLLGQPVPGAIAFASVLAQNGTLLYGFCFQGYGSTTIEWDKDSTFYNQQNILSPEGFEHCVPFARYR